MIVSRISDDHVRHVNPFLADIIWFAAAVQLSYKVFAPVGTNEDLVESKFEVLRMNFNEYVRNWNTPSVLQQNLDALEEKLERFRSPRQTTHMQYDKNNGNKNDSNTIDCAEDIRNTDFDPAIDCHQPAAGVHGVTSASHNAYSGRKGSGRGITAVFASETDQHQRTESQPATSILTDPSPFDCAPAIYPGNLDTSGRSDHASDDIFDGFGLDMDFGTSAGLPFYLNGILSGSYE